MLHRITETESEISICYVIVRKLFLIPGSPNKIKTLSAPFNRLIASVTSTAILIKTTPVTDHKGESDEEAMNKDEKAEKLKRVFRKGFLIVETVYELIGEALEKSNIHGIKMVFSTKLHPVERLVWLVLFMFTCFGAYSISSRQFARYAANPTVISLERDYRDWNGTLPALSLCYHKRVDESRAQNLIKKQWEIEKFDDEYEYFLDFVKTVVYVNEPFSKFNKFVNDKRLEYVNMLSIARDVHPVPNSVVSSSDTNAEFSFSEIITEKGICHSVNSILSPLISLA